MLSQKERDRLAKGPITEEMMIRAMYPKCELCGKPAIAGTPCILKLVHDSDD